MRKSGSPLFGAKREGNTRVEAIFKETVAEKLKKHVLQATDSRSSTNLKIKKNNPYLEPSQ